MEEYSNRVQLCPDGKYRWTYEVNLYTNMGMVCDLMRVIGITLCVMFGIIIFGLIFNGIDWDNLMFDLWVFLWIGVGFTVLCLLGYWIWAFINGGRYAALFVMDEESVTHEMMPKTMKRGQVIAAIGMLLGAATNNTTLQANSLLAASVNAWKSDFKTVRKVKPKRRRHLIKVNELFTKNRIYVENMEDYEFVLDFILERCPRVTVV